MPFTLPGFDLEAFVAATLAEDLGEGLPGGGRDVTSESVIPAEARFAGVMDSRDAIVVCGLDVAAAFFRRLDPAVRVEALCEDGERVAAGQPFAQVLGKGGGDEAVQVEAGYGEIRHPCGKRLVHEPGDDIAVGARDLHLRP
jgi:hypothetical protein